MEAQQAVEEAEMLVYMDEVEQEEEEPASDTIVVDISDDEE